MFWLSESGPLIDLEWRIIWQSHESAGHPVRTTDINRVCIWIITIENRWVQSMMNHSHRVHKNERNNTQLFDQQQQWLYFFLFETHKTAMGKNRLPTFFLRRDANENGIKWEIYCLMRIYLRHASCISCWVRYISNLWILMLFVIETQGWSICAKHYTTDLDDSGLNIWMEFFWHFFLSCESNIFEPNSILWWVSCIEWI